MLWLVVVLLGHLANAGAFIIDKILLSKKLPHPAVYAFYIGLLNVVAIAFLPFADFSVPPLYTTVQAAIAGVSFVVALLCFFTALKHGETSRVVPTIGALIPVATIPLAGIFLGEFLHGWQWVGVFFLVFGAVLISYESEARKYPVAPNELWFSLAAALLFATSFTFTKAVFRDTEFFNGLIWSRLFSFLAIVPLLSLPSVRAAVFGRTRTSERPTKLFVLGQTLGGIGFFLVAVAIKLAPQVTIVNALQGVQYAFLFLFILWLSHAAPHLLKEHLTRVQIVRKSIALAVLAVGLLLAA